MARTNLAVYDVTRDGKSLNILDVLITSTVGGSYRNSGREWVRIVNATAGTLYLYVPIPRTVDGETVTTKRWTIYAGDYVYLPPFPTDTYNYPNEQVYLDASGNLYVVVFRDGG